METFTIEEKVQVMDTPQLRDEYRFVRKLCLDLLGLADYDEKAFNVDVRTMMLVDGVGSSPQRWVIYAYRWYAKALERRALEEWDEAERLQEQNWGCNPEA